jgi:hypothetical protein
MTLRGTYVGLFAKDLLSVPRSLETRTKRGFPHSHSDYDDGYPVWPESEPRWNCGPCQIPAQNLKSDTQKW